MTDIVDKETRSRMMSGITGKNTGPERVVRRALHARGLRYRLHSKDLPGRPDIVLPKYRAVIFVHGCFWHGHHCHLFKIPATRPEFWSGKIDGNVQRDKRNTKLLLESGWRVLCIWECAIKGRNRLSPDELAISAISWLGGTESCGDIAGDN